jgi:hypothetical protein
MVVMPTTVQGGATYGIAGSGQPPVAGSGHARCTRRRLRADDPHASAQALWSGFAE